MKSPLDNNKLSDNYQRHNHSFMYYFNGIFCNARRCWRLSSILVLFLSGIGMIYLGYYVSRSENISSIQQTRTIHRIKTPNVANERMNAVKNAFIHAWNGYEKYAWGYDELMPVSKTHANNWFGLGLTAIDALDTAILMDLPEITDKIRNYSSNSLKYYHNGLSNVFELTIRILGSFLSAYNLTNDKLYLEKAVEIGDILMLAFVNTPTALPATSINFATMKGVPDHVVSISEATTIQLEFKYLTYLTKDPKYWNAAQRVMKHIFSLDRPLGLVPYYLHYDSGKFYNDHIRLGSRSDSYYEYLAKQYLQTNFTEPIFQSEWKIALRGIREKLLGISSKNNLIFIGERPNGVSGAFSSKMDHLVCFLAGTLAVAATRGNSLSSGIVLNVEEKNDLDLAEELVKGCYETYSQTATGLSPEVISWHGINFDISDFKSNGSTMSNEESKGFDILKQHFLPPTESTESTAQRHTSPLETKMTDFSIGMGEKYNLLRPETIESIFILYQITGKEMYREMGWKMFESFEKWCKVGTGGYSSLLDVTEIPPGFRDKMESFFLSETLKYFYLLFSDKQLINLNKYVINTEAHPLPIFQIDDLDLKGKLEWLTPE